MRMIVQRLFLGTYKSQQMLVGLCEGTEAQFVLLLQLQIEAPQSRKTYVRRECA